jgi:hypothetical protein
MAVDEPGRDELAFGVDLLNPAISNPADGDDPA